MKIKIRKYQMATVAVALLMCITTTMYSQQPAKKPNIVLIMLDDSGWGDLASNGNTWTSTPHIDQIRKDGLMVNRFFVSPLCAPTRASLMTGRYHLRTGTASVTGGLETMRTDETTIAEIFGRAGYTTGIFGKWHNGAHYPENPLGQGFNEFFGFCAGHWTNYFNTKLQHNKELVKTQGFITDVLTDAALSFIDKNKATPFFCYIPYNAPHGPFQIPDKFFNKYDTANIPNKDKAIYAMIDNVDENVGRVIEKIDDLHLANNTIVIFLSDNGPNSDRYNGNMKGKKGSVHEGGVRVPFYMKWPGHIQQGIQIDKIAAHIDVLPTLAELAGVKIPETIQLDGKSIVGLINNSNADWPDRNIYFHTYRESKLQPAPGSARSSQYRFVIDKNGTELYDMIADPNEEKNIAALNPDLVKRFEQQYTSWFTDVTKKGIHTEITKIGYPHFSITELFAPDISYKSGVVYEYKNGYAHDWLTGWNKSEDIAAWTIEVVEEGRFQINLKYNCPVNFTGRTIIVSVDDKQLSKVLNKNYIGKMIPSPDREPRIEAYQKDWGIFNMGTVTLKKGIYKIGVSAKGKKVTENLELKSLVVQRLKH